jgi:GxxExxY protein
LAADTLGMHPLREPSLRVDSFAADGIGAAIEVHRALGRGFLESVYEEAMAEELRYRNIVFDQQVPFAVHYRGALVGEHRLDLLVGGELVVELKAVSAISDAHIAQTLSYMKAGGFQLGLVLNFNVDMLKNGIRRVILPL